MNDAIASVGDVNREIRSRLADVALPDGYALVHGGEEEAIRENNRNLTIVILLAVFLVFVVMAVQYESVVEPAGDSRVRSALPDRRRAATLGNRNSAQCAGPARA